MERKRDYYEVLGIGRDADEQAIKKAYRKLAKTYHPDTNTGNKAAEERFKEATEAYTVLSDPEKKKLYDKFGHAGLEGTPGDTGGYGNAYSSPDGTYREFHFEGGDMGDIFGDIFGDVFGGRDGKRYSGFSREGFQSKGADLHAELSVSFEEGAFGCDKIITLQNPETPGGKAQSLQVHIPAGIEDGKSIRLRGKGLSGLGGGEPGDLLLKVHVGEKPGFRREGMDIYTTAEIPFTTAVFGGEATVPTIDGNVVCKIREGVQSGTKIRLRGKGVVSVKNPHVRGDQYVTIQIQVPRNLSPEARQKLKEFEHACKAGSPKRNNGNGSAA
ncbi:molecular chaperone DnaJ [Lactonifactor longoviformis]|uniref:Molecular chaperone DnaJ n=1 Tax=Lactonifactor longoviformis DSM 17459 TaxID=1122155 RepID=A0A1M5B997_9CLOT|nr:DnaJ C-terminal domain-containing protein [Lactonifactor longoviformis]POP33334.1 molecular chaperone DnaJ [Lactonifactor longoviformis]SHF39084.1 molecular chaperone DnaJ [Lactonifactor longoviformis DSM 17459]